MYDNIVCFDVGCFNLIMKWMTNLCMIILCVLMLVVLI